MGLNDAMIMENAVSQMLRCNGHHLYFYSRSDTNNRENHADLLGKAQTKSLAQQLGPQYYLALPCLRRTSRTSSCGIGLVHLYFDFFSQFSVLPDYD
jgi:hypothetical protein